MEFAEYEVWDAVFGVLVGNSGGCQVSSVGTGMRC